jgi:hypothetical protein
MLKDSLENFVVVKCDSCKEEKKEWLEHATFQEGRNKINDICVDTEIDRYHPAK